MADDRRKVKPFHREISLNAGHDWVEVEIVDQIPPEVKLTFGGSHFLTTQVFLHYEEDARSLGAALTEAAIKISMS